MNQDNQEIGEISFLRYPGNPGINNTAKNKVAFFQQVVASIGNECALTIDVLGDGKILENIYHPNKLYDSLRDDDSIKFPEGD